MKKSLLLVTLLSIFVNITAAGADRALVALSQVIKRKAEPLEKPEDPKHLKPDDLAAAADAEEPNDCSICLDPLEYEIVSLPFRGEENKNCGHKYHKSCLYGWVKKNKNCPTCRTPVTIEVPYSLGELIGKNIGPRSLSFFSLFRISYQEKH